MQSQHYIRMLALCSAQFVFVIQVKCHQNVNVSFSACCSFISFGSSDATHANVYHRIYLLPLCRRRACQMRMFSYAKYFGESVSNRTICLWWFFGCKIIVMLFTTPHHTHPHPMDTCILHSQPHLFVCFICLTLEQLYILISITFTLPNIPLKHRVFCHCSRSQVISYLQCSCEWCSMHAQHIGCGACMYIFARAHLCVCVASKTARLETSVTSLHFSKLNIYKLYAFA